MKHWCDFGPQHVKLYIQDEFKVSPKPRKTLPVTDSKAEMWSVAYAVKWKMRV